MSTDTAAPAGDFQSVTVSRSERSIIRRALKGHANTLTKEQRRNTELGAENPVITEQLARLHGTPVGDAKANGEAGNLPGLVRRFLLEGDVDDIAPKGGKKEKGDKRQLEMPVGNGGAKGDRSVARGVPKVDDAGAESIKAAAKSGK
jgi:hypothetical protein